MAKAGTKSGGLYRVNYFRNRQEKCSDKWKRTPNSKACVITPVIK